METPGQIEDRRLRAQALFRAQWLRERRLSRALAVESAEFWELGDWLQSIEAAAASQRDAGNMLKGDGVGGAEGCGNATGCQVDLAMIGALLKSIMATMDQGAGRELRILVVPQGEVTLEELRAACRGRGN
jgi:hypothetical protein